MVGTWDCGFGTGWFGVPPFVAHNTLATYTVTEDAHGTVHGAYRESSADGRPLVDFDDEWRIGSIPDANGNVRATYDIVTRDGFSATASGTVRGPSASRVVLGTSSFEGFITFPDGTIKNWHGSGIVTTNLGVSYSANYSFGTLGSKRVYFGMSCTPMIDQE
jgi:hypothetical protein